MTAYVLRFMWLGVKHPMIKPCNTDTQLKEESRTEELWIVRVLMLHVCVVCVIFFVNAWVNACHNMHAYAVNVCECGTGATLLCIYVCLRAHLCACWTV